MASRSSWYASRMALLLNSGCSLQAQAHVLPDCRAAMNDGPRVGEHWVRAHATVRGASPYAYSCHVTIVLVGIAGVLIGAVLVVLIAFLPPDGWTWAHNRRRPIAVTPAPSAVA